LDEHLTGLFAHDPIEVMDFYIEFYQSNLKKLGHLYKGIAEMLLALKKHGYAIAILSDKCRVYGDLEIDLAGIATAFDHVQFMEDALAYKPEPEGLIRIIERFSVLRS
jgi:phosphoglycolate phosphatase-like HAD superfamily hydrolase